LLGWFPLGNRRKGICLIRTAVIGASGYSGQELLRYLARHPQFELVLVTSRQQAGEPLAKHVSGLPKKLAALTFTDAGPDAALAEKADLFFLAVPHGTAAPYVVALRKAGKTVVDLSADFRTTDPAAYQEFYDHEHPAPHLLGEAVYGLPEIHRAQLKTTKLVAAPGCFPTSIIVPLVPFLKRKLIDPAHLAVTSLSGVSGAGRKLELRLLFGEVADNMYAYGAPKHRHLGEIEQELSLAAGAAVSITFVPHLVPIHRGMVTTTVAALTDPTMTDSAAHAVLQEAYGEEPFVEVLATGALPQAREVAHSNRIQVAARVDSRTGRLLLFSSLDNLGKGNASQAIQAANLACGLEETTGLT
jgi:N-acetyl-gamma-glutamyl-phosphate reductase